MNADKNQITGNGNGDRNSSTTQDGQNVWQMEFEAFQADEPAKSKYVLCSTVTCYNLFPLYNCIRSLWEQVLVVTIEFNPVT